MTRALGALWRGQWEQALSLHPLSPLLAAGAVFFGIWTACRRLAPAGSALRRWSDAAERLVKTSGFLRTVLALLLGVWMIRMIGLLVSGEARALFQEGWLSRALSLH